MSEVNELVWSVADAVGYLALNRPDFHNAISKQMWESLPEALTTLKAGGARVIVFSGSGSSFASGADIGELAKLETYAGAREHWYAIRDCLNFLSDFELPTIAMVNGPCLGGGCLLALACDLRYASDTATFGIPTAKLGIVLDDSNISRLIAAVGSLFAKELLFTGGTISGIRAGEIGLVNCVVPAGQLEETVRGVAQQIAGNAAISMMEAKRSVNRLLQPAPAGAQDDQIVIGSYLAPEFRKRVKKRNGTC